MIFFETTCFEFPCVAGAHFPEVGGSFSRSRWLIFPKSAAHFPKVGGSLSQSRWLIFPKSVADFPKVGGSFSRSRWLIFPKSVTDFPKIGRFPDGLCQIGGRFFQVGKVCSVASICMGFVKAKGSFGHDDILLSEAASRNKRTSELEKQLKSVCLHVALYNNWRAEIALQRPLRSYMIDRFTPP